MNRHRAIGHSECIFLSIMALLYVAFMLCDFFDSKVWLSSTLKYCSIFSCFLYCLIRTGYQNLLTQGLFFTVLADIFLLFTDYYFFGVLSFCIVQLIYFYRIKQWNPNIKNMHLTYRFLLAIFLMILLAFLVPMDGVLGITVIYFTSFIANLILLSKTYDIMKNNVVFCRFYLGMLLFFLCDICVGIFNLSNYIAISGAWMHRIFMFASVGMWGFYLPGQVLIALSCREKARKYN